MLKDLILLIISAIIFVQGKEYEYLSETEESQDNEMHGTILDEPIEMLQASIDQIWDEFQFKINDLTELLDDANDRISSLEEELKNKTKVIENFKGEWLSVKNHVEVSRSLFNYSSQEMREEIKNISNALYHLDPIPEGFVYVQFPNQSAPQDLGMGLNWVDITQEYAGLFFRAEGNGSAPFGEIQQANQSMITQISAWGVYYDSWDKTSSTSAKTTKPLKKNGWTPLHIQNKPRSNRAINHLSFRTTEGEVRPTNTAIRIWKKVINVKP